MKIAIPQGNGVFLLFTNEGLKEGDQVWPLTHGYCPAGSRYYVISVERHQYEPDHPHIIENLHHSDSKPYEVKTNRGYGPRESYFKRLN